MKQMRDLTEPMKYDLAVRIYDLMQYQDDKFAKRYLELVRRVYRHDSAACGLAATHAAIWNLAKVMLIKDEPYVSYLLTRYEKKQRDIAKYGVDVSNGDRIVYKHHTSPEFNIGKYRVRLKITTRDWHLQIARHMKWWRKLPGWHKREVQFRDWYISLLDRINLSNPQAYQQALTVLKCPEQVSGYREVRYPKMDRTIAAIEAELARVPTVEVSVNPDVLESLRRPTHV
jgi:indolepyruvate ferredoxin oxidoreductase